MNTLELEKSSQQALVSETSLLDKAIAATKQTEPDKVKELLSALTNNALKGSITFDRNIIKTLNNTIGSIDKLLSTQLAEIMHDESFSKLEGSWRGIQHLVNNSSTSNELKIKVINISKKELNKDFEKCGEFDQSQLFKKIYESEFGMPGGEPYGTLLGDYEFSNHPADISLLQDISGVAASAFCPFISAADHSLFGFNNWTDLSKPRDLEKIFDSAEYIQWNAFRNSEDSRFVSLTMPRVLARLPYGNNTNPIDEFRYEETLEYSDNPTELKHNHYCWMNACYAIGERLTNAFSEYGWCTAIRGAEGGGKVDNLPVHVYKSSSGDTEIKCPTEVGITDRREAELSKLGFLPLSHYKNTDYAVLFGAETTQKAKKYDTPEATSNAAISARLPYLMATARFAHYLKVMARDKVGSFMETEDVEAWLNRWILQYVNANPQSKQELKSKYPLAEAKIKVEPIPGKPGSYQAVAWLRPWLQLEELTTSMRLVAQIPKKAND
jgi:type VI secretion system protein ImpC